MRGMVNESLGQTVTWLKRHLANASLLEMRHLAKASLDKSVTWPKLQLANASL